MVWSGVNLFKRFLAEHRGHSGLNTSTSTVACIDSSVAACGCGAFFESWMNGDGDWTARIGAAPRRKSLIS